MNKIVFIGNFVNDVILIHKDLHIEKDQSFQDTISIEKQLELSNGNGGADIHNVTMAKALGGSVTYGSLAASCFGTSKSYIVTNIGNDIIQPQYQDLIQSKSPQEIDLSFTNLDTTTKNTSYYLNYYNNGKNRNLSLMEKGKSIDIQKSIECIESARPDIILFVPVSDELDEELVFKVSESIHKIQEQIDQTYCPIIAFDIQGFLRTFDGHKVTTRPKHIMIQKLISISQAFSNLNIISVVKAEYGEAAAIIGDHDPGTCAKLIRENFGFSMTSITMGGDGGFISSTLTGELYVPTFKPQQVTDETGCGDTFLTCTVLELLNILKLKPKKSLSTTTTTTTNNERIDILKEKLFTKDEILHCIQVGSAGASFLVEKLGPNGFGNRQMILDRVKNGAKQIKQHYLQYNSPNPDDINISNNTIIKPKLFKSITSYK